MLMFMYMHMHMLVTLRVLRHRPIQRTHMHMHMHMHMHTHMHHDMHARTMSSQASRGPGLKLRQKCILVIWKELSRPEGLGVMLQAKSSFVQSSKGNTQQQNSRVSQGLRMQPLSAMRCAFNATLRKGFPLRSHTKQSSYTCS